MFFGIPQPTPFDLHWRMFGIDVRVNPWFWVMAAVLGWGYWFQTGGLPYLFLWVLCVFVSVLLHELGHVVMGRVFGCHGHILLYSFGGLAFNARDVRYRWQRILVSFAGPLAQFILFGLILAIAFTLLPVAAQIALPERAVSPVVAVVVMLLEINLIWPLLNLLPIIPLDGGQISREVCDGLLGARGLVVSLSISVGVAGLLAVDMLLDQYGMGFIPFMPFGGIYMAIFFGLMAFSSFQMLQAELNRGRVRYRDRLPWE